VSRRQPVRGAGPRSATRVFFWLRIRHEETPHRSVLCFSDPGPFHTYDRPRARKACHVATCPSTRELPKRVFCTTSVMVTLQPTTTPTPTLILQYFTYTNMALCFFGDRCDCGSAIWGCATADLPTRSLRALPHFFLFGSTQARALVLSGSQKAISE